MAQRPLKIDPNGHVIQAGTLIGDVIEVSISVVLGFVAVTIPAGIYSRRVYFNTRDAAAMQISAVSAGTTYASIASGFWMDIAADPGDIICYVKGTSTTTLEVIVLI
jgi:hypothetical protein